MGLNPQNYIALICGEYYSEPGSYPPDQRHYHKIDLFNNEGKPARAVNREKGDKIGLSIEVLVDPIDFRKELDNIEKDIKEILEKFNVGYSYKGYREISERSDGKKIVSVTFKDIEISDHRKLGKAIEKIAENRHRHHGRA